MTARKPPSEALSVGISAEFEGLELADARLEARALSVALALAHAPDRSLPEALGSSGALEGAYRLLHNPRVHADELLEPHQALTLERSAALGRVLAVHDTTDFDMPAGSAASVGYLGTGKAGFLGHLCLMVDPVRVRPLGVAALKTFRRVRPPRPSGTKHRSAGNQTRKNPNRESLRWGQLVDEVHEEYSEHCQVVHVMDREADIYDLLFAMTQAKQSFVVRLARDRNASDEEGVIAADDWSKLREIVERTPHLLEREVRLSRRVAGAAMAASKRKTHVPRESRVARLHIGAARVQIRQPHYLRNRSTLPVHVVYAREAAAAEGCDPVDWILLTSEPIETVEQLEAVVDAYRARWLIEEFFKALKTGCSFESRMLEDAHSLENLLALTIPVAWHMLLMRNVARTSPDAPAIDVLSALQIRLLRAHRPRSLPDDPTARDALRAVAEYGGYVKYRKEEPGWLTLYKGLKKLLLLEEGYKIAKM